MGESSLARYFMMSLLNITSFLMLTDLVSSTTFVANAMEVAMRMLETGKSDKTEIDFGGKSSKEVVQLVRESLFTNV